MKRSIFRTHFAITLAIPLFKALSYLRLFEWFGGRSVLARLVHIQTLTDVKYESIHPLATYAPWRTDHDFLEFYAKVKTHTLVDLYRIYELWGLMGEVAKVGAGDVLEVGVWRGGTGAILAKRAQMLGLEANIFLADTFKGVVKAGALDTNYTGGEHSDTSELKVAKLCSDLGLNAVKILKGIFPDDRPATLDSHSFRLAHIDTDTYDSAKGVFDWVWPRTLRGGVVVFDDFGFYNCTGVTRLVEELKMRSDLLFVYNLNGHAIFVKVR